MRSAGIWPSLGIISAKGRNGTAELFGIIANTEDERIPPIARFCLELLARPLHECHCGDQINRQAHPCLAPRMQRQPAARGDPRHWPDRRQPLRAMLPCVSDDGHGAGVRNANTVVPGIGRARLGQRTLKCVLSIGDRKSVV